MSSIPGLGRSPGEGNGYPLRCSCLENSMNRGAWRATVHGSRRVRHRLTGEETGSSEEGHAHTHPRTPARTHVLPASLEDSGVLGGWPGAGTRSRWSPVCHWLPSLMASRCIRGPAGVPCQLPVLPVPSKPSLMGPVSVEATGVPLGFSIMGDRDARGRLCWEPPSGALCRRAPACALASPSTTPTSLRRCCCLEDAAAGGSVPFWVGTW